VIGSRRPALALLGLLAVAELTAGCGKKGPPLPPLVLLPEAPADFTAVRRGARVDLTFRVPAANADRSTPADLERIDIYAWTVPAPVDAAEVVQRGIRVATLQVNPPPDEDAPPRDGDAPASEAGRPAGGLEQNAVASFTETLPSGGDPSEYRAYVAVGVNTRGRRGALSPRVAVPLAPAPPAPAAPAIDYDEKAITVSWPPASPADAGSALSYLVYTAGGDAALLTPEPLTDTRFVDEKLVWDQERCYEIRSAEQVEDVRVESEASPATCVTPHDTFAPAPPEGLVAVGSEAAVSLIWNASAEADLAGYVVLRAVEPSIELVPVTPAPIADTNYRDTLPAGSRATYAVQAVDKAGNRSEPSARVTESAR
jgi:hypothetical protein